MELSPVKVLKSFSTKEGAEEYMRQMLAQGIETQILSSSNNPQHYDVTVIDAQKIDQFFTQLEQGSMDVVKCPVCGRKINENRFFKCPTCQQWECETCGKQRLFPNGLPPMHTCGKDSYDLLGNVGACRKCQRPLGYRCMPQSLRVQWAATTPFARVALNTGIAGLLLLDLTLVRMEIDVTYPESLLLAKQMNAQQGDWDAWRASFDMLLGNYNRIAWGALYIHNTAKSPLAQQLGVNATEFVETLPTKVHYEVSQMVFFSDLLNIIGDLLAGKKSGKEYLQLVGEIRKKVQPVNARPNNVLQGLNDLLALGSKPSTPSALPKLAKGLSLIIPTLDMVSAESQTKILAAVKPANKQSLEVPSLSKQLCPKCSAYLPPDSQYCPHCGSPRKMKGMESPEKVPKKSKGITGVVYAEIKQIKKIIKIVKGNIGEQEFFKHYGDITSRISGMEDHLVALRGCHINPDGTTPQTISEEWMERLLNAGKPLEDDLRFTYPPYDIHNKHWSDGVAKLFTCLFRLLRDNLKVLKANGITRLDINLFSEQEICPSSWAVVNQFVDKCTKPQAKKGLELTINIEFSFEGPPQYPYARYIEVGYPPSWKKV